MTGPFSLLYIGVSPWNKLLGDEQQTFSATNSLHCHKRKFPRHCHLASDGGGDLGSFLTFTQGEKQMFQDILAGWKKDAFSNIYIKMRPETHTHKSCKLQAFTSRSFLPSAASQPAPTLLPQESPRELRGHQPGESAGGKVQPSHAQFSSQQGVPLPTQSPTVALLHVQSWAAEGTGAWPHAPRAVAEGSWSFDTSPGSASSAYRRN